VVVIFSLLVLMSGCRIGSANGSLLVLSFTQGLDRSASTKGSSLCPSARSGIEVEEVPFLCSPATNNLTAQDINVVAVALMG